MGSFQNPNSVHHCKMTKIFGSKMIIPKEPLNPETTQKS